MNFRNLSAWSIRNPVVPIVLFVGLLLMGVVAFMRMEVQDSPDIEFPFVIVTVSQPGAAPAEIETQVTQKIEAAARSVAGVQEITSSTSEGSSTTQIQFQMGEDTNAAVNEVKNAVDQIRGELPDGIVEPRVFKVNSSSNPIAYFEVSADDMTPQQLSWFVDDMVSRRLLSIDGMAAVKRGGGVSREILVTLDPARMQAFGVTAPQVNSVLRTLNLNAAGGQAEIGGTRQSVRVLANAADAFALSNTQIPLGAGRAVKLSDIATVKDSFGEITSLNKSNGRPVVTFSMNRAKGASDVAVYDAAMVELHKIAAENPGVHFTKLFATVDYTKQQYESSMAAMVEGAVLAVIVVFFFLRDWRATAVSAIAIPLAAIPTFWFMRLMGFTLNQMSLLALGLVAGVLVDDAIVEIENIVRHMRMGKTAFQASIDAADEIGLAVVATTFSIVAVFLPVGLMPGISGQFFKNFGLTVVVSVLISLLVARMITPMVAAYFLKAEGHAEHASGRGMAFYLRVLHWSLDTARAKEMRAHLTIVRGRSAYWWPALALGASMAIASLFKMGDASAGVVVAKVVGAFIVGFLMAALLTVIIGGLIALFGQSEKHHFAAWAAFQWQRLWARLHDHRVWMIGVALGAFAMTFVMFAVLPQAFFPDSNSDFSQIHIAMVPGTTIQQTEAVTDQVNAILNRQSEVEHTLEDISEGKADIYITLKKVRKGTSIEFEHRMTPQVQAVADARVNFQNQDNNGSGTNRPISILLSGSDPKLLDSTATTLVEQMKGLKEVVTPRIEGDLRRPEVVITPRMDLAASMGVTTSALSQAIRVATLGEIDQNAAKFSLSDRQVPIRVRLPESARRTIATIANLPVQTASGGSVPLSRVADISFGSGPTTIQRYNQQRRIFVGADLGNGVVKGTAMEAIKKLPIMQHLPQGVSNPPFGQDKWQMEMITNFMLAVAAGILLVFSVLVLLYHRVISPLVNMASLFLAPLGGLLALAITGQPVSLMVFIGILMLLGIVAKNSILLIDFAIEEMATGANKFDAIIEAGHKRAQPIVMTTVAMTAGMVPTAISLSGDGAWRAPMGTVVIGGLIVSTVLTLLIVPAAFSLADGLEKRLGPKLRRGLLTFEPHHRDGGLAAGALPAE